MIKPKPADLSSCCVSTQSLIAIAAAYNVEGTLPATPLALSSGESAILRLTGTALSQPEPEETKAH